jgi:hypothetical protein
VALPRARERKQPAKAEAQQEAGCKVHCYTSSTTQQQCITPPPTKLSQAQLAAKRALDMQSNSLTEDRSKCMPYLELCNCEQVLLLQVPDCHCTTRGLHHPAVNEGPSLGDG